MTTRKRGNCECIASSRDGNRTEPEPNTPNSNPILRPLGTEPNKPKEFDSRTLTEPNYHNDRTEQNPNLRC